MKGKNKITLAYIKFSRYAPLVAIEILAGNSWEKDFQA